jgi:hypothetical protein
MKDTQELPNLSRFEIFSLLMASKVVTFPLWSIKRCVYPRNFILILTLGATYTEYFLYISVAEE